MPHKFTVSHGLIFASLFFTILTFFHIKIYQFGMNSLFFDAGVYNIWGLQMFSSQFLHGWILHFVMNAVFIFYFWNIVEQIMGSRKYFFFFIFNTVFLWVLITFLSQGNTVWISGFVLAVITYYTLHLWSQNNPEYTWWVTAIVINVAIGLSPWISFLWHFGWMVFGWVYWLFSQNKK